ncbi:MAG: carboxypeptidase-like regulatory domain-containing protein [Deltaproteobacteria bacterium]|nr:carboxypeptidase-like regulatory domain-containing protein [Myxococcales bacterium]MDP3218319.1 carboxypeptidase-like regulatory domain-containing protein [Deltaproteobacteria bacterium]
MRHLLLGAILSLAGVVSLPGCLDTQECTTDYRFGINVTVRSASSGAPIADATVVIAEDTYTETLSPIGPPGSYAGAGEREGRYTLSVSAPGFVSPAPRTVVVTGDECHVIGVSVPIELTPM